MWYVYILRCNNNSFYTGISTNTEKRVKVHNTGKGSKYTRSHRPVELVYKEECGTRTQALRREIEIKSLSSENKKRLVRYGIGERFPSPYSL